MPAEDRGRHTMALTKGQKNLLREAKQIAQLTKTDFDSVDDEDPEIRTVKLNIAIRNMVIAHIVTRYTLTDEIFCDVISKYFFKQPKKSIHFGRLWRTKKYRIFVHHILDEFYMLKKMDIVHAIKPIPKEFRETIRKLNALRNAVAHSFFPENRKEYKATKKVRYNGKDIFSHEGLSLFDNDWHPAWTYIALRSHRGWRDDY
jgi:hypothetical protein